MTQVNVIMFWVHNPLEESHKPGFENP